jgi:hypothetical protein
VLQHAFKPLKDSWAVFVKACAIVNLTPINRLHNIHVNPPDDAAAAAAASTLQSVINLPDSILPTIPVPKGKTDVSYKDYKDLGLRVRVLSRVLHSAQCIESFCH